MTPRTVGDVFERARAPYSHMSEQDARLFYSTMNALLVYTNQRLHVVRPECLRERPENRDMLYLNGGRVSDALWRNRALIEDFVRDNPLGLSEEQLSIARPWRHALRDMFTVVDANEDRAIYMNRDRLFVVGAMQDPATERRCTSPPGHLLGPSQRSASALPCWHREGRLPRHISSRCTRATYPTKRIASLSTISASSTGALPVVNLPEAQGQLP